MIKVLKSNAASSKNTAQAKFEVNKLDEGLSMLKFEDQNPSQIDISVDDKIIQYYFCLRGSLKFGFHGGSYQIPLHAGESYFFYNPTTVLNPSITMTKDCKALFLFCSLEKIHKLFLNDLDELEFLQGENANKKFYKKDELRSEMSIVISEMIDVKKQGHVKQVFLYAKALELLCLYFSKEAQQGNASCPYINNEDSIKKIKEAKDILIAEMKDPPKTMELAKRVGLNEHRLKEGFRSIYGTTLFNYLLDYKMNKSRRLLDSGNYNVKELAYDLGYSNPSHFISAFKNKFGITPKKYLQKK